MWVLPCFEWMFASLCEVEFSSHGTSHRHRIFCCYILRNDMLLELQICARELIEPKTRPLPTCLHEI